MDDAAMRSILNVLSDADEAKATFLVETGERMGLHALDDQAKREIARHLYWRFSQDMMDIMSYLDIHYNDVPDWFLWGEVEYRCWKCKAPITLTFRDRDSIAPSNIGYAVCSGCHRKEIAERFAIEEAQREAARAKAVAALRALPYCEYLKTDHWQGIRKQALNRDGHRCCLCNSPDRLDVHHRTYERLGEEDLDDVRTLCRPCHESFHKNRQLARIDAPAGSTAAEGV